MDYWADGAYMLTPKLKLKYELHYWDTKECRYLVKDFGTSLSPKSTRLRDSRYCPGRPASVPLRHTIASSAQAPQHSHNGLTACRMSLQIFSAATGKIPLRHYENPPGPTPTADYPPSLRSPWLAAIDSPTRQPLCPGTPCGRRWTRPTHAEPNTAHKWLDGVSDVLADFLRGYGKHPPFATTKIRPDLRLPGTTSLRFALHGWQRKCQVN